MKPNLNLNSAARTRRASDATEGQEGQEPPRRNVAPPPRRPVGGVDVMTARSESGAPSWSQVILPADLSDRLDPLGTSGSDTSSEADEGHSGSGRSTPEAPAASGDPLERATAATGGRPRPAWATDPRIRFSRGSNSESSSGGQEFILVDALHQQFLGSPQRPHGGVARRVGERVVGRRRQPTRAPVSQQNWSANNGCGGDDTRRASRRHGRRNRQGDRWLVIRRHQGSFSKAKPRALAIDGQCEQDLP